MSFTALAMPCNQEQFEKDLEPTLKRWGVAIEDIDDWAKFNMITNNYVEQRNVTNLTKKDYSITSGKISTIPYNPAKFLDSLFPEKWCVKGGEDLRGFIANNASMPQQLSGNAKEMYYFINDGQMKYLHKIPTDYTEVTLEELVYHYEQPKEEVMKKETEFENKTRCGLDVVIFETSDKIYGKVLEHNIWTAKDWDLKGSYEYGRFQSRYDLIPFNPRIAELKARKEELEAELEGISKELDK